MKLAGDIKNYMDSSGKTPDYAYGTSLGTCLGFENLVYMYTMILDYYNTSGRVADWAGMEPWSVIVSKPFVDPNAPKFSVEQIEDAASTLRAYVESSHKLMSKVTINGTDVTMSQFLELLTTALLQINKGNSNLIPLRNITAPTKPLENIHAGNIPRAEYMKLASEIKNYMDSSGKAPDYAYGTCLGNYMCFQNLVYMYTMILDYHNSSGKMADWAGMEPWSVIVSRPVLDPNAPKFSIDQIKAAASIVRLSIETNGKLPDYVEIGSSQVTMPQFLELLTSALLQINSGKDSPIPLMNFTAPTCPKDNIRAGNILKAEYLKIASEIKNYMDNTGKTPDYAYGTSLGTCLGFENLVYMYTMILDYYNSSGKVADWAEMKPWGVRGYWMLASSAHSFNPWTLKNSGITDIFLLTRSVTGNVYLNELQYVIDVCKDPGIRVHAWIVCFKDNNAFVNPITPGYKESLLNLISNIANNYAVNGIHLDYVRYSGVGNNAASAQLGGTSAAVATITGFVHSVYDLVKGINTKNSSFSSSDA